MKLKELLQAYANLNGAVSIARNGNEIIVTRLRRLMQNEKNARLLETEINSFWFDADILYVDVKESEV